MLPENKITKLFDYFRKNNSKNKGKLTQEQVDSINAILEVFYIYDTDVHKLAYILATTKWESAHTILPIEEYKWYNRWYAKINPKTGKRYYGRGFVQLTHYNNYLRFSNLLKLDLVYHPEKVLETKTAAIILVRGMLEGLFTGVSLKKYINNNPTNYFSARKTVNGLDKAENIRIIALEILNIIK